MNSPENWHWSFLERCLCWHRTEGESKTPLQQSCQGGRARNTSMIPCHSTCCNPGQLSTNVLLMRRLQCCFHSELLLVANALPSLLQVVHGSTWSSWQCINHSQWQNVFWTKRYVIFDIFVNSNQITYIRTSTAVYSLCISSHLVPHASPGSVFSHMQWTTPFIN